MIQATPDPIPRKPETQQHATPNQRLCSRSSQDQDQTMVAKAFCRSTHPVQKRNPAPLHHPNSSNRRNNLLFLLPLQPSTIPTTTSAHLPQLLLLGPLPTQLPTPLSRVRARLPGRVLLLPLFLLRGCFGCCRAVEDFFAFARAGGDAAGNCRCGGCGLGGGG